MVFRRLLVLLLTGVLGTTHAQDFYVVAPNTLRLNSDVTIAVATDGPNSAIVRVFIQDYPGKVKNISEILLNVQPDQPEVFTVLLNPIDFPPHFLNGPDFPKLVSLNVQSTTFQKEIIIPISFQSGYAFIQTDKPIYTPKQRVYMRIICLSEESLPSDEVFKLQIRNPNDSIVEEKLINPKSQRFTKAFVTHVYKLPKHPILGEWSATVLYGYEFRQSSTARFELQEYVLPTFNVEIKTQDVILPSTETIKISVLSKYFYGKKVQGIVTLLLGVKKDTPKITFFATIGPKELVDGVFELRMQTVTLKAHKDIGWFPGVEGSHLAVEATVVDDTTGNREVGVDTRGRFTTSPFIISFKRCLTDFKPGLVSTIEADIYYVDGTPAAGVPTNIEVLADNQQLNSAQNTVVSDEHGKVSFEIQPELHHDTLAITIETDDPRYVGNQAKGNFIQRKFVSPSNAYIALARQTGQKLQPGDIFNKIIYFEPYGIQDIYYLVVARGKILVMNKLPIGRFKVSAVEFEITHEMAPSFRIVVFAHFRYELLADSLKIEVQRVCNPYAQVSVAPEYSVKEPGYPGKFIIRGTKQTLVGLIGVDEAVYALSKKDLLTQSKVFDKYETHDLGCGHGGGWNVSTILGNAGITIGTNKYTPSLEHTCAEIKRRKRETAVDMGKGFGLTRTGGEQAVGPDFIGPEDEEDIEKDLTVRRDFRETWIFENILIGVDNMEEFFASLPHSITTWVIQAVSISPTHGICVAEPQKLVSFKEIFLHLNLPYSVVRNEQVEIQATIYNYRDKRISALMYMYDAEDLCTGAEEDKKSERKSLIVDTQSAASASFPAIPLKAEDLHIKVVVLSPEGGDVIEKTLHVVHEEVSKEINIPIKLDPTNRQNRWRMHVNTEFYSDTIDPAQNLQVTAVKLSTPEGYFPGTGGCSITAIGDQFKTVETSISNPDDLLLKPLGNGEDNMMFLASTLYTVRYLKATGKLTDALEEKSYNYIQTGYRNQLEFRKQDGSYAAFPHLATSGWLTAFVMKVFCQAKELVRIYDIVLCSGVRWLINNQEPDGSYIEKNPVYHLEMMGGVQENITMTAFTLIALEECKCGEENLLLAKMRAVAYLEDQLADLTTPFPTAIVAYALALSDSKLMQAANDKLLSMMKTDEGTNTMYWSTPNAAQDIETAAYGLLTQLLLNNLSRSNAIVNWLNTKQLQSGSFESTQDTVIALQALSEYAIIARLVSLNLVVNMSLSNDRGFHHVLTFHEDNTPILQKVQVGKTGGTLFVKTTGNGTALLTVTLRYTLTSPEKICKFDVTVNVSESMIERKKRAYTKNPLIDPQGKNMFNGFPDYLIRDVAEILNEDLSDLETGSKHRRKMASLSSMPVSSRDVRRLRMKRQNSVQYSKPKLKISLCVRYLDNADADMSVVDVGIFSGFEPVLENLKTLQDDPNHLIQRYEKSGRGVVFYLQKVPTEEHYCFSFHIVREYIVGNTQMSVIKVYDYYNPEATCSKFYSSSSHSPILRTICEGDVCECMEGGCTPENPFSSIYEGHGIAERREKLLDIACHNYDYVWKGQLNAPIKKEGGFLNISFMIDDVIKAGIESRNHVEGEVRTLLSRDNCDKTSPVHFGTTYLILGRDGRKYKNSNGDTWYRYILDKNSAVHIWTRIREATNKELQRDLMYVTRQLLEKGCLL